MPLLKIQTNLAPDEQESRELLQQASARVAAMLGKPERYVMVSLESNPPMLFGGEASALAYLELKSIGLPEQRCAEMSAELCELVAQHLAIAPERIYIEFSNAARQLWGWNGATF